VSRERHEGFVPISGTGIASWCECCTSSTLWSRARELSWVPDVVSLGSIFGCKMGATCDAVRDVAVTELEERSSGPGMIWSIRDVGETTDDCTSKTVSLGTGDREDDNGIACTMEGVTVTRTALS
jgi:hypothetical protein